MLEEFERLFMLGFGLEKITVNSFYALKIPTKKEKWKVLSEHIKKSLKWLGLDWDQGPDIGWSARTLYSIRKIVLI